MKNSIVRTGWIILACAISMIPANAQDAKLGAIKSRQCAICHGANGIAIAANAPNLAGENATYIAAQLKAFRDGHRKHPQMSIIAAELSDKDIANLATWYSLITVIATPPVLE